MSSAPPLESRRTSWKTPLPNVRVPTTSARSRSCSAPVTISDADAELAVDEHDDRDLGVDRVARRLEHALRARAPVGRDDRAVGDEDARDQHRLVQQPAAVVAQVEHDALRALVQQVVDRLAHLAVRAGREAGEPHVRDLRPPALVASRPRPTGTSTRARSSATSRGARLPLTTVSVTSVPAGPLISVVACSDVLPASDVAVDRGDHVARAGSRRAARASRRTRSARAARARPRRRSCRRPRTRRRSPPRTPCTASGRSRRRSGRRATSTPAAEALVEQLVLVDLAVVVVGDRVERLVVEAALASRRRARRARSPAGSAGCPPSQTPSTSSSGSEHGEERREGAAAAHADTVARGW